VRQYRDFTDQPISDDELRAILDVARWSGSSSNSQPWRFLVLRDSAKLRELAEAGLPQTRSLRTATAAIAITLPVNPDRDISLAYDDGRAAERILIAASMIGLGAGIAWVRAEMREPLGRMLGVPEDRFVRTIISLGHPSDAARAPKNPGQPARLPLEELVIDPAHR
jgi:nitroreductase